MSLEAAESTPDCCEMQRVPADMEAGSGSRGSALAVRGEGLCFNFGSHKTLKDLNIAVDRGVIYGLLGPSGCGKTTLLRCIVGRHPPSSGTIEIYGGSPGQGGFSVPGPGVGYMPQELALYPEITIEETLVYFGRIYQMSEKIIKERIDFLTDFLELPDKKKEIKNLSGGQQRRVSFAAALIHKPPLVILDEPTVGVDPLLRKSIWNYLQTLATHDCLTIIITTHYVEEARQAHVVGLMRDGRLLAEANPEHLIKKHKVLSLEDVFLKLCMKSSENEEDTKLFDKVLEMNNLNKDVHEDIWVSQESQRNCTYQSGPTMNDSDHKTSLLDCSSNPHSVLYPEQSCRAKIKSSAMRMRALIIKNFIRQKRCLPLVFFQLFVPTFQVIVFCLCVGGEPFDLPLAVVNSETDPSGKSNYFLEHINPQTIRQIPYKNLTQAFESVQRGENWGVLHIKPTFTDSMINRFLEGIYVDNETIDSSTIMLYLDMTII